MLFAEAQERGHLSARIQSCAVLVQLGRFHHEEIVPSFGCKM
jgi:hypothetical protein